MVTILVNKDSNPTKKESPPGKTTVLPSGEYDCPAHILAGEYKVTASKLSYLTVRRNGTLKVSEVLDVDDEMGRLVLIAGDEIEITGGKFAFEPFK